MKKSKNTVDNKTEDNLPGYPVYPASEDIYSKAEKLDNINPDDNSTIKELNEKDDEWNEKAPDEILTGDDLDIPDIELMEADEEIGEEDEENSYYSLGGDEHNNLDELNTDTLLDFIN